MFFNFQFAKSLAAKTRLKTRQIEVSIYCTCISCGQSDKEFRDTSHSTFNLQNLYTPKKTKTRQTKERQLIINNYAYISCGESGNEFPDNFEFTTEEGIFVLLELVFVHAKEIKVDSGNGFDETFERGGELELPEEAAGNASGGGAGQTDLQILRSISNFFKQFSADSNNFRFRSLNALHIQNLSNCCRDKCHLKLV